MRRRKMVPTVSKPAAQAAMIRVLDEALASFYDAEAKLKVAEQRVVEARKRHADALGFYYSGGGTDPEAPRHGG